MKGVIEYKGAKGRHTLFLHLATQKQPKKSIRKRLWYRTEEEREQALRELEETRRQLLLDEGALSLSSQRLLELPGNKPQFNISQACLRKTVCACLSLSIIDKGKYPSSYGLAAVVENNLHRTGAIGSGGVLTPASKQALSNFMETIKVLRGKAYSLKEVVSILSSIEREKGALKNIRITGILVLALINAGYVSSGMLLNIIFGRPYAVAWSKVTGYTERLRDIGLIETVFHDDTHTHLLTEEGRRIVGLFQLNDKLLTYH